MANIIIRPDWDFVPKRETTPEDVFMRRREFIKKAGLTIGAAGLGLACSDYSADQALAQQGGRSDRFREGDPPKPAEGLYPAKRNEAFKLDRPLTGEEIAATHNNFYEFANGQSHGSAFQKVVGKACEGYHFRPWEVEISGLCESPRTMTIDEIEKVAPLEERLYRFRCVETWSMAVPWTGYPLARLLELVKPKPEATHVRFLAWHDDKIPAVAKTSYYSWPFYEGLRIDEAMNEMCMMVTGIYGHELPGQHGAPMRIITPWKYGYKSPKTLAKIELVDKQPGTFWNDLQPREYSFLSNVEPQVPHPRWSQAHEWSIPDQTVRRPTMLYNGYQDQVAKLYA